MALFEAIGGFVATGRPVYPSGRRCRAIEISPPFVDVAIKRWQVATGSEATLDGMTFADVAAERGVTL